MGYRIEIKLKTLILDIDIRAIEKKYQNSSINDIIKLKKLVNYIDFKDLERLDPKDFEANPFVYFKAKAAFKKHAENKQIINVSGNIGDYKFLCNCSINFFIISISVAQTIFDSAQLLEEPILNIFFIGKIIQPIDIKRVLLLESYYIQSNRGDIIEKIKGL